MLYLGNLIETKNLQMKNIFYYQKIPNPTLSQQMTTTNYCEVTEFNIFLEDLTKYVLQNNLKMDDSISPSDILASFLKAQQQGQTVILKPFYQSLAQSHYNRVTFLHHMIKIFSLQLYDNKPAKELKQTQAKDSQTQTKIKPKCGYDYLQLIRLLCNDFPIRIVTDCLCVAFNRPFDTCSEELYAMEINQEQFMRAFYLQLVYAAFLLDTREQLNKNNSTEALAKRWLSQSKDSYEKFDIQKMPRLAILFKTLLQFCPSGTKPAMAEFVLFQPTMLNSVLGGSVTYQQFMQELFINSQFLTDLDSQIQQAVIGFGWERQCEEKARVINADTISQIFYSQSEDS